MAGRYLAAVGLLSCLSLVSFAQTVVPETAQVDWFREDKLSGVTTLRYTKILAYPNGNFVVGGYYQGLSGNPNGSRAFVRMLTPSGAIVWSISLHGDNSAPDVHLDDMKLLADGSVYVCGSGASGFVAKIDSTGHQATGATYAEPCSTSVIAPDFSTYFWHDTEVGGDSQVQIFRYSNTLAPSTLNFTFPGAKVPTVTGFRFINGAIYAYGVFEELGPNQSFEAIKLNSGGSLIYTLQGPKFSDQLYYNGIVDFDATDLYFRGTGQANAGFYGAEAYHQIDGSFDQYVAEVPAYQFKYTAGSYTFYLGTVFRFNSDPENAIQKGSFTSPTYSLFTSAFALDSFQSVLLTYQEGIPKLWQVLEAKNTMQASLLPTLPTWTSIALQPATGEVMGVGPAADGNTTVGKLSQVPVLISDSYTVSFSGTLNGTSVLANDHYVTGLTASLLSYPQSGTITFNSDGTFTYHPQNVGNFTFKYLVQRPGLPPAVGLVAIKVQ